MDPGISLHFDLCEYFDGRKCRAQRHRDQTLSLKESPPGQVLGNIYVGRCNVQLVVIILHRLDACHCSFQWISAVGQRTGQTDCASTAPPACEMVP